jgi:hypothetical protein
MSACREVIKRTGNTVYVNFAQDVIEAYRDEKFRFGKQGWRWPTTPDSLFEIRDSGDLYKNYLGLFYASMGLLTDEPPALDLPTFEPMESVPIIQPMARSAENPPTPYVQMLVNIFYHMTGEKLCVVGAPNCPHFLQNVRYEFLDWGISKVMKVVANSSFVITCRSLTAHLAAGYHKPTFLWYPNDGKEWHMNYPNWNCSKGTFYEGVNASIQRLIEAVIDWKRPKL